MRGDKSESGNPNTFHLIIPPLTPTCTHTIPSMSSLLRLGLLRRPLLPSLPIRSYSGFTHSKEVDPQLNGYPQLSDVSRQSLPARGWWDIQMRRNFGDTACPFFNPSPQRAFSLVNGRCMSTKRSIPCGAPIFLTSILP